MIREFNQYERELLGTLFQHGPRPESQLLTVPLLNMLTEGYVMRCPTLGPDTVILTTEGYRRVLELCNIREMSSRELRAISDLELYGNIPHADAVRTLIADADTDDEVEYGLWLTVHTEGRDTWFSRHYAKLNLPPKDAMEAARYALCLLHSLMPLATDDWTMDESGMESSARYPMLHRTYDENEGKFGYSVHSLTREYACYPGHDSYGIVTADWGQSVLHTVPPVPFVQYYADPNSRVPVRDVNEDYMSKVGDYPTIYPTSVLLLSEPMAQEVIREATRVIEASYNQYPNNDDAAKMVSRMRREVSPLVRDAVIYAVSTKPAQPVAYGRFEIIPITVERESGTYCEVCWKIPVYPKRPLTVERINHNRVRIV